MFGAETVLIQHYHSQSSKAKLIKKVGKCTIFPANLKFNIILTDYCFSHENLLIKETDVNYRRESTERPLLDCTC